ncbi:MAG: hypothetical protein KGZ57_10030 [Dethiobacter sp.]|nr:hypothetical protein [Dethiobacter sp.]
MSRDFPKLSTFKDYIIVVLLAILVFAGVNNHIFARSDGSAALSAERLRQRGLEYYAASYGDAAVEAVVRDFGCHQEIHIYKEGQLVLRITYWGGELYALPEV